MSDFICPYTCSYRTNSGYCGRTGGAESCQYRMIVNAHGADATVFAGANMRKPITNYDRFVSKTPEEMADILVEHGFVLEWYCGKDEIKSVVYQPKDAKNKLIDWLKQEAPDAK